VTGVRKKEKTPPAASVVSVHCQNAECTHGAQNRLSTVVWKRTITAPTC
jgi:hypothetical protein